MIALVGGGLGLIVNDVERTSRDYLDVIVGTLSATSYVLAIWVPALWSKTGYRLRWGIVLGGVLSGFVRVASETVEEGAFRWFLLVFGMAMGMTIALLCAWVLRVTHRNAGQVNEHAPS
jgi:hypothetical protein